MNIGVFDSGLGGLSILREILTQLPKYNYIYLGDNARAPYGDKSQDVIYDYTLQAIQFLIQKKCKLIILACNTATTNALRTIQQTYLPTLSEEVKVLGVVRPAIEAATEKNAKRVGILGTSATIRSESFPTELHKMNTDIYVVQKACPLLVPMIEAGESRTESFDLILHEYLDPLKVQNLDTFILGCTHYGLVADQIQKIVPTVHLITEATETAIKLKEYLRRHTEIENTLGKNGRRAFFVTDLPSHYEDQVKLFLGDHYEEDHHLEKISLI